MASMSLASQMNSVGIPANLIAPMIKLLQKAQAETQQNETKMKVTKPQREKKIAVRGPKRPLNSWMAFRKFYSASLSPNTQKAVSKILTRFWREDPFEAKWTILAKAYSILRGNQSKEEVPLDTFFYLSADVIGIIPPEQYQILMCWEVTSRAGQPDDPIVKRIGLPQLFNFPEKIRNTTCSSQDLVSHCRKNGFGDAAGTDNDVGGHLAMAVAPEPDESAKIHEKTEDPYSIAAGSLRQESMLPPPPDVHNGLANFPRSGFFHTDNDDYFIHGGVSADMYFDPASSCEGSWDPAAGLMNNNGSFNEVAWDAFDLTRTPTIQETADSSFDISEFFDTNAASAS